MAYRNGTYVAFDGCGTINPTESDIKYYGLLQSWNKNNQYTFSFSDSHKKTYKVKDTSTEATLKARLLERMKNSKQMLLIISSDTNWDRGMLNYEIEKAVDYYKIPIIVAYTGYEAITAPQKLAVKWTEVLYHRINYQLAHCIHIPFKKIAIENALNQFSVHDGYNELGALTCYTRETYMTWGLV